MPEFVRPLSRNMLDVDPPDHTRLRGLVHKAFTPRLIEDLRDRVQSLTDELLDAVQGEGRMDLIRDYAMPLPTTIIAEMLGVPAARPPSLRAMVEHHRVVDGRQLASDDGHTLPVGIPALHPQARPGPALGPPR